MFLFRVPDSERVSLRLVGKNGKKVDMAGEVMKLILKMTEINEKEEYSDSYSKALANALKDAVTRPPYNRPTTKATLLAIARFFKVSRGFTVEKWSPQGKQESSKSEPPLDPRTHTLFKTVRQRLDELEGGGETHS